MPAKTAKQRRYLCADLARARRRQETGTGMSEKQLREFCKAKPTGRKGATRRKR